MKNLKSFKLFIESLSDDFKSYVNSSDKEIAEIAQKFLQALPDANKQEFMYRISDGEDLFYLMQEFLDKYKLSDENQFQFRVLIMNKKINELKSNYNEEALSIAIETIEVSMKNGFEFSIDDLKKTIEEDNIPADKIIITLEDAIDYLTKSQELANWVYERPDWNPNKGKIEMANKLLDFLKDYYI